MTSLFDVRALALTGLMLVAQGAAAADSTGVSLQDWLLSAGAMIALVVIFTTMFHLSGAVTLPTRKGGQRRQVLSRPR